MIGLMNTKFQNFYSDYSNADSSAISELYAHDVIFKDPLHEIKGLSELQAYFARSTQNLTHCAFRFIEQSWSKDQGFVVWDMDYAHPRLAHNKTLCLRGMSHLRFTDRITYHEDVYDVGAMVYEHVPVIGTQVRWLKKRLLT